MATGSEILSYNPNAALAFGSTALPAGSTDAILDTSPALAAWQQYAQAKYLKGKEEFDRLNEERLKNAKALNDAINIGNYKIWDADRDRFMGDWGTFMQMVKENPTAVYDPSNPEYLKVNDKINELKQTAAFSSQQKTDSDTNENFVRLHGDKVSNPDAIGKYRDLSIEQRAQQPIVLEPKIGLNLLAYQKSAKDAVKYLEPTTQSEFEKGNNVVFTTEAQVDVEGTKEAFGTMFESAGDDKIAAEEIWRNSPIVQQSYATPKDFFVDALFQISGAAPQIDTQIKGQSFSPFERADAANKAKPQDSWLVDLGLEVTDPNSTRYNSVTVGNESFKFYDVLNSNLTINNQPIAGFIYKDGKQYALPAKAKDSKGAVMNTYFFDQQRGEYVIVKPSGKSVSDLLIPIEDGQFFGKIIQPYLNKIGTTGQQYTTSQDLQNYAEKDVPQAFDKLGIPRPQGTGNNVPSQKKYTLAEIKAAHSKELAGFTDAEIMEAYKDILK